jgi:ribonuclease HI
VKINVDAGVHRHGGAGAAAAVARSDTGEFLGASATKFDGLDDPETLEALAVREGMHLAKDLNLPRLKVASDCLGVVKSLREHNLGVYSHIISDISMCASEFSETSFVHESRTFNKEANDLARFVVSLPLGRHVWFVNPPEGVCIPRFLN